MVGAFKCGLWGRLFAFVGVVVNRKRVGVCRSIFDKDEFIIFISKSCILLYVFSFGGLGNMNSNGKDVLQPETKDYFDSKSEIIMAVLAVISKKSRELNRTIAAASLREIKTGLKKHYNKDLSERHILNMIHSLEKLVIKEGDPRNHRRSLYRINPNFVEEATTLTLVKLDNEQAHNNNDLEGILYSPLIKIEKKRFLVIDHKP
jgi:hypothetical protein